MADKWSQYEVKEDKWAQYETPDQGATLPPLQPPPKTAAGFVGNVLSSTGRVAKGFLQTVAHPIDTATGIGELLAGGVKSGIRAAGGEISGQPDEYETAFNKGISEPVKKSFQDPGGVPKRLADYSYENPVEQLMNISLGLGVAGKLSGLKGLSTASNLTNPINAVTKPVTFVSNKVSGKLAKQVTPEIQERIKLGEETGVPLTPADITGGKAQAILEMQLRENVGSTNIAEKWKNAKLTAVSSFADRVEKLFGGSEGKLEAGQIAQKEAWPRYRAFQKQATDLRNNISVSNNAPIETSNLAATALEEIDELGKLKNPTITRILNITSKDTIPEQVIGSNILDAYGKPFSSVVPEAPAYTWGQLLKDQSTLGKMIESTPDRNQKRILYKLKKSIDDDIIAYGDKIGDPALKGQIRNFKDFYRDGDVNLPGIRVWSDRQIRNMMKTSSPSDIVNNFIKAKTNIEDIGRLKQVVGEKGFQPIKQAWLQDMLTKGEDLSFNPTKFVSSYDRYKRGGNLDVMLNADERAGLDKLYKISKITNTAEKIAGNPSGTGRTFMNAVIHWVAHPVYMIVSQVATNRIAQLYFENPTFRKLLTTGLDANSKSAKAVNAANKITQLLGSSINTNLMQRSGNAVTDVQDEAPELSK
jgi:hypothetical protein